MTVDDVPRVVHDLGGVCSRAALVAVLPRALVDQALRRGTVVADARGRYCLPSVDQALRLAHRLGGVLCLVSAAQHLGWEVREEPDRPHVLLPRKRKVPAELRAAFHLHRRDLLPEERSGSSTSVALTLEQCLRALPFADALSVADSALRHDVPPSVLRRLARTAQGPGAVQVRRVVAAASASKANPFESSLHSITLDVPGLCVVPQVRIASAGAAVRPDLVDERLGIVLEADSFTWHGGRAALRADARRYDELVVDGWLVLRFAWEDVVHDPTWVRSVLVRAVALRVGRTEPSAPARGASPRRGPCPGCGRSTDLRTVRLTGS